MEDTSGGPMTGFENGGGGDRKFKKHKVIELDVFFEILMYHYMDTFKKFSSGRIEYVYATIHFML